MTTKQLTMTRKVKWISYLINRDGKECFYCEQRFIEHNPRYRRVFDHLNNNEHDNRVENLVLCHSYCNELKKKDLDWQILA